ncbi:hypothetical protein LSTR_LSTR013045 [Laodelphax striatellus]|uniref:Uncharacterized protein n=1 Tax=Laodelphax striatellus TaxID=195883 RepID=A0A482XDX4_LAOST|nr:hypothetical protein LSTR_LSTR013045 [Laodelphax striatellus]
MSGGVELETPVDGSDPLTHYFHKSPEHCSVSFAAINKMRQNIQADVESVRFIEILSLLPASLFQPLFEGVRSSLYGP